jgi:hypothetical protein
MLLHPIAASERLQEEAAYFIDSFGCKPKGVCSNPDDRVSGSFLLATSANSLGVQIHKSLFNGRLGFAGSQFSLVKMF